MSLLDPSPAPTSADVPVAIDFRQRFLGDVHTLIAEGYVRLVPTQYATSSEESISDAIVERINEWFDSAVAPAWTKSYFVKPEIPVRRGRREGKKRPRIDIYVESSDVRPRARFAFEAKRFYRSDSVAEYVGASGLGAFLDGTHALDGPYAGMLGFVQQDSVDTIVEKVREKLDAERELHGLPERGAVWMAISLDTRIGTTWVSRHKRLTQTAPTVVAESGAMLDVYNSFIRCYALSGAQAPTRKAQEPLIGAEAGGVSAKPAEVDSQGVCGPKGQMDLLTWRPKS